MSKLRSRLLGAFALAAALVALYALFGHFAVPRLVRRIAVSQVRERYGRALAIGEVRFQPFALRLEIRDLALPDADGGPMLGLGRLVVDFELSSLWHRTYTFKEVRLDAPRVRAVVRRDGTLNLAELAATPTPQAAPRAAPQPAREGGFPRLWLRAFAVTDGDVRFEDGARTPALERRLEGIAFSLRDFRTDAEGGAFHLAAHTEADERLDWTGRLVVAPALGSEGELHVTGLRLPGLAELAGDAVPCAVTKGFLELTARYRVTLRDDLSVEAELPELAVTGLAARARGAGEDWVELRRLTVTGTRVALPARSVRVERVLLSGLRVRAWRERDGALNLMRLAPPPEPRKAPQGPPWAVQVGSVALEEGAVAFEDRVPSPPVALEVAPIQAEVKGVSLDLARALPVRFELGLGGKGHLTGAGQVTPNPPAAQLDLALTGLELPRFQPYLAASTALQLASGALGVKGQLAVAAKEGAPFDVRFVGDVAVDRLRAADRAGHELFALERLELDRLRYATTPAALSIERILLRRPESRVVVNPDRTLNVLAALAPPSGAPGAAPATAAASPAASSRRAAGPTPRGAGPALPVRIAEVKVEDGRLDFSDLSIQPQFAARVTELGGRLAGLSTDPASRAKIDLRGKVGPFSPVTIAGEVQPFAYDRFTDVGLRFAGISLPIFNPYSGKYAGYAIAKGKLTTDLHYTIRNRKLDATHHVRIDQLEWGPATAQKGAATLPVRFATALLRDSDGVIDLDLPVSGTLDDPSFRVWPIVWQVVKNVVTKAVTAPFRALASLFKGSEKAQFVDFGPGDAALDPEQAERLAGLGKTLAPKTDLRVSVPYGALSERDAAALAARRYETELAAALKRAGGAEVDGDAAEAALATLPPAKQRAVLTALLQHLGGDPAEVPAPPPPPEGASAEQAKAAADADAVAHLQELARARAAPGPSELDALGEQRVDAIQAALVNGTGLDAQRVFAARGGKITAQGDKVRLELSME